jgi:pimeloyl-ACP methyl ester carboxylesterase
VILRAVERDDAGPGAGGRPLVLLHGLLGRAANFGAAQARLAARRRVLALDLRGHGGSPHARPIDYPSMAADVADTLRALDVGPCVLLGHSMGGKVAMTLASRAPEAVAALLVADIAPVAYPSHFGGHVAAMRALDLAPGLTRAGADAALRAAIPDRAVRQFLLQNLRVGAAPAWACDLEGIAAGLPDIEAWPDPGGVYPGPALFLTGGRSAYVRPEGWAAARALFPAATLETLPDAGHWVHAEDPDGFVAAVDRFARAA